ncbi:MULTISPECIES: OmpA family protein [unclassified Isoptericola]|uniref:OmpA family protein n=1 Tax=unclassified Isoptericola TaxID=2623355 RepID=UPI0036649162
MRPHLRTRHPRRVLATAAIALVGLGAAAAAAPSATAATDDPAGGYAWPAVGALDLGEPSQENIVRSVTEYVIEGSVLSVDDTTTDGDETVVTLSSDILFDPSESTLSKAAKAKVADLVEDVPDGATVSVDGHTDSVDTDAFNQKLSEQRAKAVAGAIKASRGDLKLQVHGYGETRLKAPETGDAQSVADARAQNRRVELRYGG